MNKKGRKEPVKLFFPGEEEKKIGETGGTVTVIKRKRLNLSWSPPSWKKAADSLYNCFARWCRSDLPGYFFSTLIGAAGYGKSFIIREISDRAVKNHVFPLVIDSEYSKSPTAIAKKLLDWFFPIKKIFDCDDSLREDRRKFLTGVIRLPGKVTNKFIYWLAMDGKAVGNSEPYLPGSDSFLSEEGTERCQANYFQKSVDRDRQKISR